MVSLISPSSGAEISLLSHVQKEFIKRSSVMTPEDARRSAEQPYNWFDKSLTTDDDASKPATVLVKWKNDSPSAKTVFHLATDPDFTETRQIGTVGRIHYSAEDDLYFLMLTNLLSGTTYYWKVSCGDVCSETRSFSTVYGEMRTIRADGVGNVRDIGGRVNKEGKRIRQGLVYRGAMLNNLEKPEASSLNGLGVMRDDLAIKTDIDLRWEAIGKYEYCQLGDHINYRLFTAEAYEGILTPGQDELFRQIIEMIADEDNYPVYFHCVAGADRTGSVGFILDGILGMSDEDIITNYNLTALTDIRCWHTNVSAFTKLLNEKYPGLSLSEQIVEVVRSFGVSEETLSRIRHNLIEE